MKKQPTYSAPSAYARQDIMLRVWQDQINSVCVEEITFLLERLVEMLQCLQSQSLQPSLLYFEYRHRELMYACLNTVPRTSALRYVERQLW